MEPILTLGESFFDDNIESTVVTPVHPTNKFHVLKQHAASSAITITLVIGALLIWKFWTKLCKQLCCHAPKEADTEPDNMLRR
jgi:hypothetical protein